MKVYIEFEDFGKIKSGRIDLLCDFSVFVGENNSGKTFVMQLLYAVKREICKREVFSGTILPSIPMSYVPDDEFYLKLQNEINDYLEEKKEKIVKQYFHRAIPIGKLRITIDRDKDSRELLILRSEGQRLESQGSVVFDKYLFLDLYWQEEGVREKICAYLLGDKWDESYEKKQGIDLLCAGVMCAILGMDYSGGDALFLPASRTGMLLLYKYFFSEKDKRQEKLLYDALYGEEKQRDIAENELGLTGPVYDFLQFLLRYAYSERNAGKNAEIIDFIEKNLLDGRMIETSGETLYQPEGREEMYPLYLSSSMVNEVTPIVKMLTAKVEYRVLYFDEIETCLHPEKQKQMARLLIRMCNAGIRLTVSTHSDTMAAKLNNLFLLSYMDKHYENFDTERKLKGLGLAREDLLQGKNCRAYQFVNVGDGKSEIRELDFQAVPEIGFDFEQFAKSSTDLYEETLSIIGRNHDIHREG